MWLNKNNVLLCIYYHNRYTIKILFFTFYMLLFLTSLLYFLSAETQKLFVRFPLIRKYLFRIWVPRYLKMLTTTQGMLVWLLGVVVYFLVPSSGNFLFLCLCHFRFPSLGSVRFSITITGTVLRSPTGLATSLLNITTPFFCRWPDWTLITYAPGKEKSYRLSSRKWASTKIYEALRPSTR